MRADRTEPAGLTSAAPEPLRASRFLLRNPRRVLPSVLVQALVTALVLAVVTPLTGFEEMEEVELRPLSVYTAVTPMSRAQFDEALSATLDGNPALERRVPAKALWMRMPMIVGEAWTMLVALDASEQEAFLARVGDRIVRGALPASGTDGVAIHADAAKARGLDVGDAFGQLVDPEDPTPGRLVVTGIVDGPARVGVADLQHASKPLFVLARVPPFQIVYAKAGRKAESDAYLNAAKDADGRAAFKVWDEAYWRRRVDKQLENLPLILNAVVGALTLIISMVVVLFNVIGFQARSDEFGLLLALGHTRRRLARKIAVESGLAAAVALALGIALGLAFLGVWTQQFLEPKAIRIRLLDPYALGLAAVLPLAAAAASAVVLAVRLRRMDPVAILQRRNA